VNRAGRAVGEHLESRREEFSKSPVSCSLTSERWGL